MAQSANVVQLKPRTLQAFETYIREAEEAMESSLRGRGSFCGRTPAREIATGSPGADRRPTLGGGRAGQSSNGLIHDWIGAAFVPEATVEQALALVQNYDNHKNIYKPEVIDSKLISHQGTTIEYSCDY